MLWLRLWAIEEILSPLKITLCHCEFEDFIRNRKLSKYLGVSKWKNEVMAIKNTPNKNDWPRAILELFLKN